MIPAQYIVIASWFLFVAVHAAFFMQREKLRHYETLQRYYYRKLTDMKNEKKKIVVLQRMGCVSKQEVVSSVIVPKNVIDRSVRQSVQELMEDAKRFVTMEDAPNQYDGVDRMGFIVKLYVVQQ